MRLLRNLSIASALTFVVVANPAMASDSFTEVSLDELKTLVKDKKATIIDANTTETFAEGHVPGAVHYSKNSTWQKHLPAAKTDLVVAYCGGPMCTAWEAPAKEAKQLGYTNIKHFKGGIKGWKDAKLSVEQNH